MTHYQRVLAIAAKAKLRRLKEHCDDACPGWAVFETQGTFKVQRCDACWHGLPDKLMDHEAAALPEARELLTETKQEYGDTTLHVAAGGEA